MLDDSDIAKFLKTFLDAEDRARAMREFGWEGHPDLERLEAGVASVTGGPNQQLLAALQPPPVAPPKRQVSRFNRVRNSWPKVLGRSPLASGSSGLGRRR